ncbi:MAG: hypothetical protein RL479_823 [Verrucomicrobiota bacterium]
MAEGGGQSKFSGGEASGRHARVTHARGRIQTGLVIASGLGARKGSGGATNGRSPRRCPITLTFENGAQEGTRTLTPYGTRPSNVCVYQFHHLSKN